MEHPAASHRIDGTSSRPGPRPSRDIWGAGCLRDPGNRIRPDPARERTGTMATDRFMPTPKDRFSFGIWTVGWQGADVFGSAVRPPMPAERAVRKLAELGAYGVNFHDDDVFGFAAGEAERDERVAAFRAGATSGASSRTRTSSAARGWPSSGWTSWPSSISTASARKWPARRAASPRGISPCATWDRGRITMTLSGRADAARRRLPGC